MSCVGYGRKNNRPCRNCTVRGCVRKAIRNYSFVHTFPPAGTMRQLPFLRPYVVRGYSKSLSYKL